MTNHDKQVGEAKARLQASVTLRLGERVLIVNVERDDLVALLAAHDALVERLREADARNAHVEKEWLKKYLQVKAERDATEEAAKQCPFCEDWKQNYIAVKRERDALVERLRESEDNPQVGMCRDCGTVIWRKQERIIDDSGMYHPICRIKKERDQLKQQLADLAKPGPCPNGCPRYDWVHFHYLGGPEGVGGRECNCTTKEGVDHFCRACRRVKDAETAERTKAWNDVLAFAVSKHWMGANSILQMEMSKRGIPLTTAPEVEK